MVKETARKKRSRRPRPELGSKVSVRLSEKHMVELERYAEMEGMTVSFLIRHLVCRFIEAQRWQSKPDGHWMGGFEEVEFDL